MSRIYFYLFASINLLGLTCLFIVSFVNVIFIREEFIEIPVIETSNIENFIKPNEVKNDDYNFKILNNEDDNFLEKLNSKKTRLKKGKEKTDKNLFVKNNFSENDIKKFVVQLGVFKNKKNADSQLLTINKHKKPLYEDFKINLIKTNDKKNNALYYIETNQITKINAINLCDYFKNKKINCIIKIKK